MTFSHQVIKELLAGSTRHRLALRDAYGQLPATRCRRRTDCCSLLPEVSLLEALSAIQLLMNMTPGKRQQLSEGLIHYFFLNPAEILMCPFLKGKDCSIYEDRFLGCRAYGLWSRQYYEEQAARSRQAKQLNQKQWRGLGVDLPQEVVNFYLPYCPDVELEETVSVDDEIVLGVVDAVEEFSGQLPPWHDTFRQGYFSDLSFLLASLAFGTHRAIQLKFEIVRGVLVSGENENLPGISKVLPDLWTSLA